MNNQNEWRMNCGDIVEGVESQQALVERQEHLPISKDPGLGHGANSVSFRESIEASLLSRRRGSHVVAICFSSGAASFPETASRLLQQTMRAMPFFQRLVRILVELLVFRLRID